MNGQKIYSDLRPGQSGSLTFQGKTDDSEAWDNFEAKVEVLRAMAQKGLIRIDFLHKESQTGRGRVDMVRFVRLAP